jgi:hypothetical protein
LKLPNCWLDEPALLKNIIMKTTILMILISICFNLNKILAQSAILFERIIEPNENAFSILKPAGWLVEGGIIRLDPTAMGGAGNSIEAKLDFTLKKDQAGTVMIHWLPDMYYVDLQGSYVAGMFPVGSTYNGMTVIPKMPALQFATDVMIRWNRGNVKNLVIKENKPVPKIIDVIRQADAYLGMNFGYDAVILDYTYNENGIEYRERLLTVVQDMGPAFAGMWKNRNTIIVRSPASEFKKWEPVFCEINYSPVLNLKWIEGEVRGQIQRGEIATQTIQEINRIDQEIQQGHIKTNSEINHEMYLNLTGQEDYVNPFTNQSERGSNEWNYRWVNDLGNVIYTDEMSYNPNNDPSLHVQGYKLSKVKNQP